ncbi:MAG: DUF4145 domain-containing protein [Campylobacterales bacterium]|nr:DUF4145 domain-containing protein [Campylobacterales bacterium]
MANNEGDTIWSICSSCNRNTMHEIKKCESKRNRFEPADIDEEDFYMVIMCRGCLRLSFRKETHDYKAVYQTYDDEWSHDITVRLYPKFLEQHKNIDTTGVPSAVDKIYHETIVAIQEKAFLLAGLGLRGTLEAICNQLKITGKDLKTRIGNLHKSGYISKKDADRLHGIRFMGNDAAHEIKHANLNALMVALDIVEYLISTLYIFDKKAKKHLDTTISSFEELLNLLTEDLKNIQKDEIFNLQKWFKGNFRRISENREELEKQLKDHIKQGLFDGVELYHDSSAITSDQLYKKITEVINDDEEWEIPF